ncbi:MAG TPA: DUF4331 domain-containing protein [Mycobacteriales bacterium]|nr:DUF4331 domain-containing protein [Mycobacteriales bacterium]
MMRACPTRLIAALLLASTPALASSHREAPDITEMPKVDGTDFYMFRSYEPGRADFVTLIANYIPLQDAYGGPNYFSLDAEARYRIHVDNNGDGVEDVSFQFRCTEAFADIKLPVGGQQVSVPVINVGQISGGPGSRDPDLNRAESCTLGVSRGRITNGTRWAFAENSITGSMRFGKPVDNIGEKSIPDYAGYARQFITDVSIPGCTGGDGRLFIGQRKEPFAVNLGEIFDLVNIANPLGPRDAEPSATEYKNVTSFILEVPAACLTRNASSPVIGGWTTALLPKTRVFNFGFPTGSGSEAPSEVALGVEGPEGTTEAVHVSQTGPFSQVSRLGMPLVNEVVIGLKDKNRFNWSSPAGDAALALYVTNPTLPEILEILFGAAGVRAPNNFPRTDLVAAFATGVQGLNFLSDGQPHEMLRLNTSIAPTPAASQNNLGVLGGDNAGFPNGRRPGDDVVDIELRVAMGVLCHAFPGVFCTPADAPSGNLPFTDGTLQDASQFEASFPYLATPLPGSPNGQNGVFP